MIFFDDDFKESVKVTNVQKCDFSQILNTIFSKFSGGACPGPLRRPKKYFYRRHVAQKFFPRLASPQTKNPR